MNDNFRRSLIQLGLYSTCVTLPKDVLDKLSWKKGDEVEIEINLENQRLIISKVPVEETELKPLPEI